MQQYPVKTDGSSSLGAPEYNDYASGELNNFVTNSGQTLSAGNPSQMGVASANYAAHGEFFTDSGSANVYVLATQASKKGPNAYVDGMRARFQVGNTNTGASTINVNSLGVKNIKQSDGSDLIADQLVVGDFVTVFFDDANNQFVIGETSASRNAQVMANTLENVGIEVAFGAGAMTVALKQKDGSADPTGASPAKIGMRSTVQTDGAFDYRIVGAALSVVASSGSTLGLTSAVQSKIYVYAIEDESGGVELAISQRLIVEDELISTSAEGGAGAADDKFTIYSTTARTGVPAQLLGYIISTQTTAGTWAQTPTTIWVGRETNRVKVAYFRDVKAAAAQGGTFTSGAWQTRLLSNMEGDLSIGNLASNQMEVGPGDYRAETFGMARGVDQHKTRLRDTTGGGNLIIGSAEEAPGGTQNSSVILREFSVTVTSLLELQHICATTRATNGFGGGGVISGDSESNIFAQVKLTKLR